MKSAAPAVAAALLALVATSQLPAQQDTTLVGNQLIVPLALPGLAPGGKSPLLGTIDSARAPALRLGSGLAGLAGQLPGLRVHQQDVMPGTIPDITLFGRTTLERRAMPRYALDGIPLVAPPIGLSLRELAEVDVVDGQRAATWLGQMASDGLLHLRSVVPTSTADAWSARINVGGGVSLRGPRTVMNTRHRYLVGPDGYVDADGNPVTREQRVGHPSGMALFEYPELWDNEGELFRTARTQTFDAVTTGSVAGINVIAAGSHEREEGIVQTLRSFERMHGRLALQRDFGSTVRVSATVHHASDAGQPFDAAAAASLARWMEPDLRMSAVDEDGSYMHPVYRVLALGNRENYERSVLGAQASWAAREWLVGTVAFGRDLLVRDEEGELLWGNFHDLGYVDGQRQSLRTLAASATIRRPVRGGEGWGTLALVDSEETDSTWYTQAASGRWRSSVIRRLATALHLGRSIPHGLAVEGSIQRERNSSFPSDDGDPVDWRAGLSWDAMDAGAPMISRLARLSFDASHGTRSTMTPSGPWIFNGNPSQELLPERTTETIVGAEVGLGRAGLRLAQIWATTRNAHYIVQTWNTELWSDAEMDRSHSLASLGMEILRGPGFRWTSRLNVERHAQRLVSLERPCIFSPPYGRLCAGEPLGVLYGQVLARTPQQLRPAHAGSEGAFAINDDGYVVAVGAGGSLAAPAWGTNVVIDGFTYQWGLPIAAVTQQPVIMNSAPNAILGFTNSFTIGGLTLTGVMTAQVGGKVHDRNMQERYSGGTHPDVDQSGRPEAERKSVLYYNRLATYGPNEHFVRDAGHAALEEVSLSYQFGREGMISRSPFGGAELSIIGRGLAVWGSEAGYDAARGGNGPFRYTLAPKQRQLWVRLAVGM
jgi:hypothetical protein